ncbi:MAG: hypothetical protein FIB01_10285 [Gemmatimonadetes bacterium]|nr:hypothetical protein [Gemmatimonadota bacterium]
MTELREADPERATPPAMGEASGEPQAAGAARPEPVGLPGEEDASAPSEILPSRAWRFCHASFWIYAVVGVSLLIILVLFGMMCSPVYWRF